MPGFAQLGVEVPEGNDVTSAWVGCDVLEVGASRNWTWGSRTGFILGKRVKSA